MASKASTERSFTPGEAHAIVFGLRIAAEQYRKDKAIAAGPPVWSELVTQFDRQAQEAESLADAIDNGIELVLHTCPACDAGLGSLHDESEYAYHALLCPLRKDY